MKLTPVVAAHGTGLEARGLLMAADVALGSGLRGPQDPPHRPGEGSSEGFQLLRVQVPRGHPPRLRNKPLTWRLHREPHRRQKLNSRR